MTSKIRIKMGPVEVEYEGSEDFLRDELLGFVERVSDIYKGSDFIAITPEVKPPPVEGSKESPKPAKVQGTMKSIASKLGCDSGPDLVIAASAYLTFVENQETFARKDILQNMKSATGYFRPSYSNNLTQYLRSAIDADKLVEIRDKTYTLSPQTRKELEEQLAT